MVGETVTIQPVIPLPVLLLLGVAGLAACIWALIRARSGERRAAWFVRLALVVAVVVLALRPGLTGGSSEKIVTDTDVFVVVDVTGSMSAEDEPNGKTRFDLVREDITALVEAYPGARFALISFAAAAQLRMPLTSDSSALLSSVAVLTPEPTTLSRGSSIGIAAATLERALSTAAEVSPDRARMVFYLGDGEQTSSAAPESFQGAADYISGGAVLGYGTAKGGPMKVTVSAIYEEQDPGYIMYQGQRALSVIDEAALKTIAEQLGVEYQHRDGNSSPSFPPASTVARTPDGVTGTITDLTWVVALVVGGLLLVEIFGATVAVTSARAALRGRRTA